MYIDQLDKVARELHLLCALSEKAVDDMRNLSFELVYNRVRDYPSTRYQKDLEMNASRFEVPPSTGISNENILIPAQERPLKKLSSDRAHL